MKRLFFVAVVVCGAVAACNSGEDSIPEEKWRPVDARLDDDWGRCCRNEERRDPCKENEALQLLSVAHGECLDHAVAAAEKRAPHALAAAYLIRAQRNGNPVDYLRALRAAPPGSFNRALAQEKLGLTREAVLSWDDVARRNEWGWVHEARGRRRLLAQPVPQFPAERLTDALRRRDLAAVREIVRAFPTDAAAYFEKSALADLEGARVLADALAETGDVFARDVVDATARTKDREGIRAFLEGKDFGRAATLLKRAGNPLYLSASYEIARDVFIQGNALPVLDPIAPIASQRDYHELAGRIHALRANAMEFDGEYFQAYRAYEAARVHARTPKSKIDYLSRRSANYAVVGAADKAFHDAFAAVSLLPSVTNLNARHHAYGTAAKAAHDLGFTEIALQFQNAAVEEMLKEIPTKPAEARRHLAVALRQRADFHVALNRTEDARRDLAGAFEYAQAGHPKLVAPLKMRIAEVEGQLLLARNPPAAVARFSEAIALAEEQDSTYRAYLHYRRALARRTGPEYENDLATALELLRNEATALRDKAERGKYEELWKPYFARFQSMHHPIVESRLRNDDVRGAFVHAEQARAFEPMQLLLQAGPTPPGFQRIESAQTLQQALASLDDDTLILQYVVLDDRSYVFALSRGEIRPTPLRAGSRQIRQWVKEIGTAIDARQNAPIITTMRAVYDQLFATPLAGSQHERVVIVPDGPMHGLPFAALHSTRDGYLLERSSIAVAGSTSLYLYALHRDRQFRAGTRPHVLIVSDPAIHPAIAEQFGLGPIPNAAVEAGQLHGDYPGSQLLHGRDATTERFFASLKNATIVHFAGHGVAIPHNPWRSMLVLARDGKDAGDLTAEKLLDRTSDLDQTRLIVLAACSSASGKSVGPEGLAPLVRPLVAARVPAIVGTLWDVDDTDTLRQLLVSLHRHYRNGDDVAVALRKAQLEMLRNGQPARTWASLQAIGYAASPYAHHAAREERHHEHLRNAHSLHRPDGLRSQ